jgi:multiple sugar transport system permease protein
MPTDFRGAAPELIAQARRPDTAAPTRWRRTRRTRRTGRNPLAIAVLLLFAVFFGLPVLWLLLATTKTADQLVNANPLSFGSWHALRANWDALMRYQDGTVLLWLRNSAVYSFLALAITLVVSIPAGYALALTDFPGRRTLLVTTLVVMVMPSTTLVVPLFLEINAVHLIGSMWSIILPFSFYPFGIYLAYIFFTTAIPRSLLEAARLDGCTEFGAFRRVVLPLATPVVALVGFFSFVANWTNYFLPYVLLPQSTQLPIQVGLSYIGVGRPALALATVLATIPVLAVFLFSQRFLVMGMLAGTIKE